MKKWAQHQYESTSSINIEIQQIELS